MSGWCAAKPLVRAKPEHCRWRSYHNAAKPLSEGKARTEYHTLVSGPNGGPIMLPPLLAGGAAVLSRWRWLVMAGAGAGAGWWCGGPITLALALALAGAGWCWRWCWLVVRRSYHAGAGAGWRWCWCWLVLAGAGWCWRWCWLVVRRSYHAGAGAGWRWCWCWLVLAGATILSLTAQQKTDNKKPLASCDANGCSF